MKHLRFLLLGFALLALGACSEGSLKPDNLIDDGSLVADSLMLDFTGEVSNLSGGRGDRKYYSVDVPAGAKNLQVRISGGSGDADLYVKFGSQASNSSYDCRPYLSGNNETCSFANPQTGSYSVMIRAYRSYSGLTLRVTYDDPVAPPPPSGSELENGSPVTGLSGAQGSQTRFTLDVPSGADNLEFTLSGGSGDADLYVNFGSQASTSNYDCRPYLNGNNETCSFAGPQTGTYHVLVRGYRTYSGTSLVGSFDTGTSPPPPPTGSFDIEFVYGPNVTNAQKQLFQDAATRWEQIITGELPSTTVNKPANTCGQNEPAYSGTVSGVVIYAEVGPRDGPGGILASAGPCLIRSGSQGGLTSYGVMNFDSADSSGADLFETILHEMGHVLGVGTLWENFNLVNYSSACPATPRYSGSSAKAEWLDFGGSGDIPVEDGGGSGTRCGHWDEETFNTELMTGYSEGSASEPLSRMTAGTLEDMGYAVNKNAADSYSLPSCSPNCASISPQALNLAEGEILLRPVGVSGPDGSLRLFKTDTE